MSILRAVEFFASVKYAPADDGLVFLKPLGAYYYYVPVMSVKCHIQCSNVVVGVCSFFFGTCAATVWENVAISQNEGGAFEKSFHDAYGDSLSIKHGTYTIRSLEEEGFHNEIAIFHFQKFWVTQNGGLVKSSQNPKATSGEGILN